MSIHTINARKILLSNMEKKVSFGFSKVLKKSNILPNKLVQNSEKSEIELIKCLEGQSIQLVEERAIEAPLVIPLKDTRKTSAALLSLKTRKAVLNGDEVIAHENMQESPAEAIARDLTTPSNDIEARAARELLAEINSQQADEGNGTTLVLPVKVMVKDGAKESTIDDYDSIPITQFGLAMLRGMGWKDEPKKKSGKPVDEGPMLRPKGMGLGADKALKPKPLLVPPEANENLEIKKEAFIRVLGGKHKDLYGQIEGLDDHAGRVIVKMSLGGAKETFNEFMVQPVSRNEYEQYSKCINSAMYDEYKRKENQSGQSIKTERTSGHECADQPKHSHSNRSESHDRKHKKSSSVSKKTGSYSRFRGRRDDASLRSRSSKHSSSRAATSRYRSKSGDSLSSNASTYRSKHKRAKSKKTKKGKTNSREMRYSAHSSSGDERRHTKKTKKSKRSRSRSGSKCRR